MRYANPVKEWLFTIIVCVICLFLFFTGFIFDLNPSVQIVIKKTFLFAWFYLITYIFRRIRLGKIEWTSEDKKIYYYILLICGAIIFAFA